jgi:hypothetical protein
MINFTNGRVAHRTNPYILSKINHMITTPMLVGGLITNRDQRPHWFRRGRHRGRKKRLDISKLIEELIKHPLQTGIENPKSSNRSSGWINIPQYLQALILLYSMGFA